MTIFYLRQVKMTCMIKEKEKKKVMGCFEYKKKLCGFNKN